MPKTRKQFQSEQSQAAILEAAMNLISKHGFSGTTLEHVAAEAGLSKGTIFWHFDNKEKLFLAVVETIREGLLKGLLRNQSDELTPGQRLNLLLDNYTSLIETNCSRCLDLTVLIIEMVETNPAVTGRLRDLFGELAALLIRLLKDGIRTGEIRKSVDPEMTAYTIVGNLQGMTVQYYLNRDRIEYRRLMDAYKRLVADGLFM
jgi:AcrR family transcriptional regulator